MGNLFGKKPKGPEISDVDRAVLQLKTQKRQLTGQRKRIEGLIQRELEVARELIAAKKRDRALLALKKKHLKEQQLEQIDAYLLNVEEVLANIETAQRQHRLFDALKQGSSAIKALQSQVTLEDVEALVEDNAAAREYEERVRELLDEALGAEADAAALQELARLEAVEAPTQAVEDRAAAKQAAEAASVEEAAEAKRLERDLPSVPSTVPERREQPGEVREAPSRQQAEPLAA